MMFKNKNSNIRCCDDNIKNNIIGYLDGDLNVIEIKEIEKHLSECKQCNLFYNSQKKVSEELYKLQQNRNEYLNSINSDEIEFNIDKIMKKINDKKSKKYIFGLSYNSVKNMRLFTKGVYAVVAIVFIVSVSFLYSEITNRNEISKELNGDANYTTESEYFADQDESIQAPAPEGDFDSVKSISLSLLSKHNFSKSINNQLIRAFDASIGFIETQSEEYKYIAILKYTENEIQDFYQAFDNIFQEEKTTVDLKIITGDNEQKLLEYVDEALMLDVEKYSKEIEFGYVIILIGR